MDRRYKTSEDDCIMICDVKVQLQVTPATNQNTDS